MFSLSYLKLYFLLFLPFEVLPATNIPRWPARNERADNMHLLVSSCGSRLVTPIGRWSGNCTRETKKIKGGPKTCPEQTTSILLMAKTWQWRARTSCDLPPWAMERVVLPGARVRPRRRKVNPASQHVQKPIPIGNRCFLVAVAGTWFFGRELTSGQHLLHIKSLRPRGSL